MYLANNLKISLLFSFIFPLHNLKPFFFVTVGNEFLNMTWELQYMSVSVSSEFEINGMRIFQRN